MATMYYRPYSADPMQPEENFPEEDAMENVLPEYEEFFKDDRVRRKDRRNQTRPPRRHKGTNMPNQGQGMAHPRTPADVIKRASEQPRRDTPTRDRDDPTTRDIIELESVATDQDGYTEPGTPSPPTSGKKKPVEEADRYRHALRHMGQDILALRQHTRQLEAANALLRRDLGGLGPLPLAVPTAPVAVGGTVVAGHPVVSHPVAAAPHHGGPIAVPAGATIVTTTQPYGGGTTVVEETVTHPGGHVYTTHHGHGHGHGNACPCPGPSCTVGNVPHVHVEEEVSTIPHPDLVDRYGALRAALHKAATEMIEYKDKVQRLQNEIIKRQDKEEEYLRLTKAHQTQAQLLQRLQERAQRTAKLEEALRNQEKVIEKLELLLRQQHSKDEAYEALAEENRRLRAELDNLRGELAHNYRGSQDEMERLHLYQLLDRAEAKIAALERQLADNARRWGKEKQEMVNASADRTLVDYRGSSNAKVKGHHHNWRSPRYLPKLGEPAAVRVDHSRAININDGRIN